MLKVRHRRPRQLVSLRIRIEELAHRLLSLINNLFRRIRLDHHECHLPTAVLTHALPRSLHLLIHKLNHPPQLQLPQNIRLLFLLPLLDPAARSIHPRTAG